MDAVVVDRLRGDSAGLAKSAAAVLGVTAYDVRASLNVPNGGPAVLATFGDPEDAKRVCEELRVAGFDAAVVAVDKRPPWFDVKGFELRPSSLHVHGRGGETSELPYASVELLVRASTITTQSSTKTVRERKFSPVRSVLTGGLSNTKLQKSTTTSRSTESEEVLFVFHAGGPALRMADGNLVFQGLGAQLQPSRAANFAYVTEELQRRCPAASYDERLRRRSVQNQMLGRTLSADDYFDFAVVLLAASLRG